MGTQYLRRALATLVAVVACSAGVQAQTSSTTGVVKHPKMSWTLSKASQTGGATKVDVIVTFHTRAGATDDDVPRSAGATVRRNYESFAIRAMQLPANALARLADDARVKFVTQDGVVRGSSVAARQTARTPGSTTSLNTSNAGYTGYGIPVAVLDSGVHNHDDLSGRLIVQRSFLSGAPGSVTSGDAFGHGTHVAGTIGGDGHNSSKSQYQGVSTQGGIVSLQVLNGYGMGIESDLIAALEWIVVRGKDLYGIRIANLSLGKAVETPQAEDPLVQAVHAVWNAGVVVVVAAGNYGLSGHFSVSSPGNARKAITVGSLTDNGTGTDYSDDYVSTYSSRGPTLYDEVLKPDLLAPGNRVISTYAPNSLLGSLLSGNVMCGSGGNNAAYAAHGISARMPRPRLCGVDSRCSPIRGVGADPAVRDAA